MLQWMGGSRRKVTSSRKSIHNRQKQYFEQRKRQQHVTGVENQSDAQNQDHYSEEPRSLDILSLINLATSSQQGYCSETRVSAAAELDGSQDSQFTQLPPENMSRKATSGLPEDLEKSWSKPGSFIPTKISAGNAVPSVPTSYGCSSRSDKRKLRALAGERTSDFINKLSKQEEEAHNVNEQFSEVSVLDLLDDGPTCNSDRGPVPEGHVAFSVEGLGKVGIGTPAHSPRQYGRNLPSPPKAPWRMRPSSKHKSYQYNLGIKNDGFVNMDDNKYGAKWKKKPPHAESFPPSTCKAEKYHSFDYDFGDSPSIRTLFREDKISDLSVSSAKHFRDLTAENNYSPVSFDQERCHSFNEMASPDGMFSPPDWSFLGMEDSQDSTNLLSEESFSSSAVRGERSFHFGSHPVNLKKGKFMHEQNQKHLKKKYDLVGGFSPDKTDHAGFEEFLHEQKIGAEKYRYMADEWNSKAGHFSKHNSAFQENLEPDHVSFWKDEHKASLMASAPSFFDGTFMEMDTESFSDKLMSEDDLFNSFPVPEPCPNTKSTYEGSKLKNHMNQNFIYEKEKLKKFSGVDIPSPVAFPWETEDNFLYPSSAKDFDRDYQFPRLSKQRNVFEDNEVEYRRTPEKPQNKDSDEKNSLSSNGRTGDVADNKKNCCENVELKDDNQELFDGPQTKNPSVGTEEEAPAAMEEVSSQLESSIDDKLNRHFDNHAPVPSQVPTKDFVHESFESESKNAGIKGCHKGDASYQIMLESYVFQILCVRKVLLRASEKDIKKKVG